MLVGLSPQAPAKPAECTKFLTGHWAGKGTVSGFGRPIKADNDYTYKADGHFATINRYLGSDGKWSEQKLVGQWKASAAPSSRQCTLKLTGSGASAGSSSSSTIEMIDRNTFRSLGFDMKRMR
jgi:hypothetical protein